VYLDVVIRLFYNHRISTILLHNYKKYIMKVSPKQSVLISISVPHGQPLTLMRQQI